MLLSVVSPVSGKSFALYVDYKLEQNKEQDVSTTGARLLLWTVDAAGPEVKSCVRLDCRAPCRLRRQLE